MRMRMRVSKYVLADSLNSNRSTCPIHIHWISDGGLSGHIWLISCLMPKSLRCLVSLNALSGDISLVFKSQETSCHANVGMGQHFCLENLNKIMMLFRIILDKPGIYLSEIQDEFMRIVGVYIRDRLFAGLLRLWDALVKLNA